MPVLEKSIGSVSVEKKYIYSWDLFTITIGYL